ncbi:transferrin-binding protein-like solute binding protein [Neisseria sp. RH3002v2f]|uniref:transferrin-binding protein-like solute binding protein n=1 Tax=Neisseria sp. RH3002v2f TaxID=1871108 RepID=UPI001660526D|nr:transferrin-binding protein-like solute binding protein [Neisseria sp. RH3002v2f]MBD0764650.1 hypothetical protein [Neisseria sp. RH3002v2f]
MSQISSKLKLIAAVTVGAAMLSACGSKQQATPNTHSTTISQDNQNGNNSSNTGNSNNNGGNTSDTNNGNANNNNTGNNTNQPPKTNSANDLSKLEDLDPIPAAHIDTPKTNQFISSADAQQKNPNVQLRRNAENKLFQTDNQQEQQNGLIDTLDFNANDEIKINAGATSNNGTSNITFQPSKSIIVYTSNKKGSSKTNLNEGIEGEKELYELGKSSLDAKIIELKKHDKELEKQIKQIENSTTEKLTKQKELNELKEERTKVAKEIQEYTVIRKGLEQHVQSVIDTIAYIKPKDGLMMPEFDGAYVLAFEDGTKIIIHDPAAAGWTYQTFASYVDPRKGTEVLRGFQSIGKETEYASIPEKGTATYKGISTAYLVSDGNADRQLSSNVKAIVDFGLKGVRFETSGSQINAVSGDQRVSNAASEYDLKGTATWKDSNLFLGKVTSADGKMSGNLSGKFFGPNTEEIGGTYGLKNTDGSVHFLGGYGAKRK